MSGLWPLICISQVAHRGLLWYLALCCFFPRTLLPSHWCRSERVRPICDEKQLSSYTRERMWNFLGGKKRSRENDLVLSLNIKLDTQQKQQNSLPLKAVDRHCSLPEMDRPRRLCRTFTLSPPWASSFTTTSFALQAISSLPSSSHIWFHIYQLPWAQVTG